MHALTDWSEPLGQSGTHTGGVLLAGALPRKQVPTAGALPHPRCGRVTQARYPHPGRGGARRRFTACSDRRRRCAVQRV